jgi:hypothetical protein
MPIKVKRTYQDVVNAFSNENCKLMTTEEEFNEINNKRISGKTLYKYVAACGHENNVLFRTFLYKKTGVLCPKCIIIRNSKIRSDEMAKDKLQNIKLELDCILYFMDFAQKHFILKKAYDACKADIIMKPSECIDDKWIGIQVKTCNKKGLVYGFHIDQNYSGIAMLCICKEDRKMWIIPYEIIEGKKRLSIGLVNSKYSKYELTEKNFIEKLNEIYNKMDIKTFEEHDTPLCIYQQREKEFQLYREKTIDFIRFIRNDMEGFVYDFKIGDKKIQEKIGGVRKNRPNAFVFEIVKNGGLKIKEKNNHIQYDLGDNDFYWLNCDNKKHFYVIPEKLLYEKNYIGNDNEIQKKRKTLRVNSNSNNFSSTVWLSPYLFDYENIDKDRILNILDIS